MLTRKDDDDVESFVSEQLHSSPYRHCHEKICKMFSFIPLMNLIILKKIVVPKKIGECQL